jgi:hypothetical protein
MPIVALSCLLLIALTTVVHYEVLRVMHAALPVLHIPDRAKLLAAMFGIFAAHFVEIALYGGAIWGLGHHMGFGALSGALPFSLENCLYFSAETYTSLGLGDIAPTGALRLVAGVEALNGLVLIGWSASFAYLSMERFWNVDAEDTRP